MPFEALAKKGEIVHFVHLLENESDQARRDVGLTSELRQRLGSGSLYDPPLRELDARVPSSRDRKALIPREQSRIEHLRKRNIDGVIGRKVASKAPNAPQKKVMRITADGKVHKIGERRIAAFLIDFAGCDVAAEDLSYFDIEQMRRVQALTRFIEKAPFNRGGGRRAKKDFQQRRCIDDDHLPIALGADRVHRRNGRKGLRATFQASAQLVQTRTLGYLPDFA